MPDLRQTTALGGAEPRSFERGPISLTENNRSGLVSLALRRGAALPAPFGLRLPGPGGSVRLGETMAFWTGPDQWMIEGDNRAETDFASEVLPEVPGCSVTDQTDGFTIFEIRSSAGDAPILALMSKLVNIDAKAFGPGSATRTGFEHMSVFVIRRAADHLAILAMRSAAETVWHVVETATRRLDAGSDPV